MKIFLVFLFVLCLSLQYECRARFVKFFPDCGRDCDTLINRYVIQHNASIVSVDVSITSDAGRYIARLFRDAMLTYSVADCDKDAHLSMWTPPPPPPSHVPRNSSWWDPPK
jgi:hypothetical protein